VAITEGHTSRRRRDAETSSRVIAANRKVSKTVQRQRISENDRLRRISVMFGAQLELLVFLAKPTDRPPLLSCLERLASLAAPQRDVAQCLATGVGVRRLASLRMVRPPAGPAGATALLVASARAPPTKSRLVDLCDARHILR
jgi:hypothetical protein